MRIEHIEDLSEHDFTARADQAERVITAQMTGTADLNVKEQLERFLKSMHEEAKRLSINEVVVDFRSLEFMNSSCLKDFVDWISSVADEPPERQYRIVLISNPSMHWQRRSLHALSCFASDLVTVQS